MSIHYHDIGGCFADSCEFCIDPHFDVNFRFFRLNLIKISYGIVCIKVFFVISLSYETLIMSIDRKYGD